MPPTIRHSTQRSKLAILAALEDDASRPIRRCGRRASASRRTAPREILAPQHALDLLKAFRQDVTKSRYDTWDELIEYCRYSAMPVGRFVLDVHGEARSTWAASDALVHGAADHQSSSGLRQRLSQISTASTFRSRSCRSTALKSRLLASLKHRRSCSPAFMSLADRTAGLLPEASLLPRSVADLRLARRNVGDRCARSQAARLA